MPTPAPPMPPGLQTIFANSLKRPGATGDAIQSAINQAAQQYGGEGLSYMALWWMLYADKGRRSIRLQYLYVQREALEDLGRRLFENVNYTEDVQQSDSDVFKFVGVLRDQCQANIDQLEKQLRGGQVAQNGTMTHDRLGLSPVYGQPDPNSPVYLGDPLARRSPGNWPGTW